MARKREIKWEGAEAATALRLVSVLCLVLIILLAATIFTAVEQYCRAERAIRVADGLEKTLGNMFEPVGGNPADVTGAGRGGE